MKNNFPKSVVQRNKHTRKQFLNSWKSSLPFRDAISLLEKGILVESGYISSKALRQLFEGKKSKEPSFISLWSILTLETWFQLFINRPVTDFPSNVSLLELIGGAEIDMRTSSFL